MRQRIQSSRQMAGADPSEAGLLDLGGNPNECRPTHPSLYCWRPTEDTLWNSETLGSKKWSFYFPNFLAAVVRSMQEGGAQRDLLMATKNQPVQLVCPKAFPGQRLIKRTPPIPVSKENAYTMYVHTCTWIHTQTCSGILTAPYK